MATIPESTAPLTNPGSSAGLGSRHIFKTGKTQLGFYLCCLGQLCIFSVYNIISNLASTIHGTKAVVAMSIVYGVYIFSSTLAPVLLASADGRAPLVMFCCTLGYIFFCAMNIYGRIYTLCIGGAVVGCGGPMWTSNAVHISKISLYCAERKVLVQIQGGELCDQLSDEHDPPTHFMRAVTDPHNTDQIDWYLGTILDKNNRLLLDRLTHQQLEAFKVISASQIGAYTTISWLFMQASTIIGGLLAFGILHIHLKNDPVDVYHSDVGSVRILYGLFTGISIIGSILYFIAMRVIPKRVYYVTNHLSKWDLHLQQSLLQYTPDCAGSFSFAPSCLDSLQERIEGQGGPSDYAARDSESTDRQSSLQQQQQQLQQPQLPNKSQNESLNNNDESGPIAPIDYQNQDKGVTGTDIGLSLDPNHPIQDLHKPRPSKNPMSPTSMVSVLSMSQYSHCTSSCGGGQCKNTDHTNPHSPNSPIYTHSRSKFPGSAANDVTDDDGIYQRPPLLKILSGSLFITWQLLKEPAMILLFLPMFTAYAPFSFTVSAYSSKGGVKDEIGVRFVPLFIALVAGADCFGALALKTVLKTQLIARLAAIVGLSLQLVSVVLMYEFPHTGWDSKHETWKYTSIIAILMGLGDSFSVSGISTLIATMTRSRSELLSAGSSILMTARGLGLCTMFALTANTNSTTFRTIFWPIVVAMIAGSILFHTLSLILNPSINVDRALQLGSYAPTAHVDGNGDVEMQTTTTAAQQQTTTSPSSKDQGTAKSMVSDVLRRHRNRHKHRHNHHHHHHLNHHPNMSAVHALSSVQS